MYIKDKNAVNLYVIIVYNKEYMENIEDILYVKKNYIKYIESLSFYHQTISHFPAVAHFLFLFLHKRLNVVFGEKPIISLSSCILNVKVDSCVPIKYLSGRCYV